MVNLSGRSLGITGRRAVWSCRWGLGSFSSDGGTCRLRSNHPLCPCSFLTIATLPPVSAHLFSASHTQTRFLLSSPSQISERGSMDGLAVYSYFPCHLHSTTFHIRHILLFTYSISFQSMRGALEPDLVYSSHGVELQGIYIYIWNFRAKPSYGGALNYDP